jgi:hypothetical protein
MKLRGRELRSFTLEEQIGKHSYKLKLPARVRLHQLFHVNNYDIAPPLYYNQLSKWLFLKETMRSLTSLTSLLCASSRYPDVEANTCSSWRTSAMTTFHLYGTGWMKYIEQRRYKNSKRSPNGTNLPRLARTSTSCTLTQPAFMSHCYYFSKVASTTEVCLAAASRPFKRGSVQIWRVQSCNSTLQDIVHVLVTNSNSCFSIGRTYNVATAI